MYTFQRNSAAPPGRPDAADTEPLRIRVERFFFESVPNMYAFERVPRGLPRRAGRGVALSHPAKICQEKFA